MATDPTSTSAASFFEEHRELADLVHQIDRIMLNPDRTRSHIEQKLGKLVELVQSHFAHEEAGGYMADALVRAPRLASMADKLLAEHTHLLDDAHKLQMLARAGVETASWWRHLEADFRRLKSSLLAHEHAENYLMHEAFSCDIGTGD